VTAGNKEGGIMSTTTTVARKFKIGDTVRLSASLEAEWLAGRIAGGHLSGQPFGRISSSPVAVEYCGSCEVEAEAAKAAAEESADDAAAEQDGVICAGPFYVVDDVGESGLAGVYAEHELRPLADVKWTKPRLGSAPLTRRAPIGANSTGERCPKCSRGLSPVKYHDCGEQPQLFDTTTTEGRS
jgi:hypothetical protein